MIAEVISVRGLLKVELKCQWRRGENIRKSEDMLPRAYRSSISMQ